ncbi:uncharacterized protein LOC129569659 isoform X4 [Sitodiplosis mosellana]|uniref:uncharacterized protein LOC129569659 isoform X4 n=1 Tax=Sitodiplosis mosellana TaxID=263140 RepID=UPI002443BA5F|nr:uncharacterized protein LOC129569659 isoform X4 [Sitodiplosis mosellana]
MSQMREITTINRNSNSDASEKLTNGSTDNTTATSAAAAAAEADQYSLTSTIVKSDRNNNNVMKKSMPPPLPPKRHQLRTSNNSNSITAKTNTDPVVDNNRSQSNGDSSGTSHDAVINHNHGPNALIAQSNELHNKLSNVSMYEDNGNGHTNGRKGQPNRNRLDSVTDSKNDLKTASGFNAGTVSSDNNKKLNDDIVGQSSVAASTKSGTSSGISHHCDNGKGDKRANDGAGIDMVDSSTGTSYCIQRPEEETVMLLKNDERRLPNSSKRNDKQTNSDATVTFDKHQNNCDNLREKIATNDNKIGGVNSRDGDNGDDTKAPKKTGDDLFADDFDEDPYAELQSYLDKVKREINEVLEQRKLNGTAAPVSLHDQNDIIRKKETIEMNHNRRNGVDGASATSSAAAATKHDSLLDAHCRLNAKIIRNASSLNAAPISANHGSTIRKTNEWAESILKDLDNLIMSNQRYTAGLSNPIINAASNQTMANAANADVTATGPPKSPQKRSTIINVVLRKTTPSTSPTSPTAPTAFASTPTNLNKNQTTIITTTKDNNKMPKPEKHSFSVNQRPRDLPLSSSNKTNGRKYAAVAAIDILEKYSKQFVDLPPPSQPPLTSHGSNNFPVLKIEEEFDDIPMTNGAFRTISTQTSPVNELNAGGRTNNKKDSSNSLWTSDESILRSGETVDEDTKSSASSSACEETGGVISSGKSDSSGLDNDNAESGIGTATPPKDQENWRQLKAAQQQQQQQHVAVTRKNWVRQESVMTQTNYDDLMLAEPVSPLHKIHHQFDCAAADDLDNLDVLSLCEGTTDEYDNITEDDYLSDDRKLDKSIDTASSCTKSSSAERDDDSDVVILRNQSNATNRASSAYSLPRESVVHHRLHATSSVYPILYSDKSLHGLKSECSSSSSAGSATISNSSRTQLPPRQRPFVLHLHNESAYHHNALELPSPSSASLHSGHGHITMQELTTKCNSAPILLKKERKRDNDFVGHPINLRYSRSQSDRYLAEIEAIEACKWLRAAGFPQYACLFEDLQFPIDLSNVAKDHPFLENDPLQSLYRRLVALNRCATMRLDSAHKHGSNNKEESEDDEYALSENWTFQQTNRRWSRVGEMDMQKPIDKLNSALNTSRESSPENNDTNDEQLGFSTLPLGVTFSQSQTDDQEIPVRLRRTGSERLKDGAKAFLRRVESIKSRRRKRQNRDGIVISGPQTLDLSQINPKINDMKTVNIITMSTPPSPVPSSPYTTILTNNKLAATLNNNDLKVNSNDDSSTEKLSANHLSPRHFNATLAPTTYIHTHHSQSNRTSPLHFFTNNPGLTKDLKGSGDDSSSYCSDASQESSGGGGGGGGGMSTIPKKRPSRTRRFLQKGSKVEDIGALSDSECHQMFTRQRNRIFHDGNQLTVNSNNNSIDNSIETKPSKFSRGGSLNLGKESQKFKESFKSRSFRSRSSARVKPDGEFDHKFRTRSSVVRWHSFQNGERPEWCKVIIKTPDFKQESGTILASMSCGQLQVVRKLALVTLTGYMERYCPSHRSGWNWELPKFIKKIKTPDYKDKRVFGVPLVLFLQRTGQTLPTAIQTAFKWLKLNALDQVGLFRKSGVKSRIAKLKEVIEDSQGDVMETYDLQQAYDVADMLKQYFRELPDTLLTAKMSDTFIAIFQHLPSEVHFDAVQSAILLLPDEHREVLQYLLEFLHNVASHSMINQMTSNNLAVCLAPSLFNGTFSAPPRSNSVSPRRRKPIGMPDSRELTETRASHDCLTYMIENYRKLFSISNEKVQRCNFNYMEESKPVPLEGLGEGLPVHDWRGYLYECTSATIKEGREKSRGWISLQTFDPFIDVAHKKVGDGHPLRLWRCTTDIEATPMEILHFIFKERRQWDTYLMKCRIVEQLDDHSEIFQYATGGHVITDYCVLRSWRADLPRGACVIVETSVAHPDAHLLLGGVRGVVLASRYLIEPIGNGKSKIMHLARVDTKGRSPEWYNKCYGYICSQYLSKIRSAFKHHSISSDGKSA